MAPMHCSEFSGCPGLTIDRCRTGKMLMQVAEGCGSLDNASQHRLDRHPLNLNVLQRSQRLRCFSGCVGQLTQRSAMICGVLPHSVEHGLLR